MILSNLLLCTFDIALGNPTTLIIDMFKAGILSLGVHFSFWLYDLLSALQVLLLVHYFFGGIAHTRGAHSQLFVSIY
jgi:hypothetical protein